MGFDLDGNGKKEVKAFENVGLDLNRCTNPSNDRSARLCLLKLVRRYTPVAMKLRM